MCAHSGVYISQTGLDRSRNMEIMDHRGENLLAVTFGTLFRVILFKTFFFCPLYFLATFLDRAIINNNEWANLNQFCCCRFIFAKSNGVYFYPNPYFFTSFSVLSFYKRNVTYNSELKKQNTNGYT